MKPIIRLSWTLATLSVLTLYSSAQACTSVQTTNATPTAASVVLTLLTNTTPADVRTFQVAGLGNHLDTLNLGPRSETALSITAVVSQGALSATCQLPIAGCLNAALTISMTAPICTPPPAADVDDATCKHDNGNHWGEYRQLGMVVPPHSGKPNATKPCKSKTPPPISQPPVCAPQLSCTLLPHE